MTKQMLFGKYALNCRREQPSYKVAVERFGVLEALGATFACAVRREIAELLRPSAYGVCLAGAAITSNSQEGVLFGERFAAMTSRLFREHDLDAVLARTPFLSTYGMSVVSCGDGECRVLLPFQKSLERPGGIVSGMSLMGTADVAMWLAIMTMRGVEEPWVTSDMKTSFLRRAANENVTCHARVLKLGKRTAYGTVESIGAASGLVAHHVVSYVRVRSAAS